jgi:glyoxalase/bleomycin resistance protein/dioxygenase superfamily protein
MAAAGIAQVAFIVRDLRASMASFAVELGVGPWLVVERLRPCNAVLRGEPVEVELSLAAAYSGSTMVELIEHHSEATLPPLNGGVSSDCAFHHVARVTGNFEADHAGYLERGHEPAFAASLPDELGGARFAYFDAPAPLPGYVELVELTPVVAGMFAAVRTAAEQWDGQTLVLDAEAVAG